LASHSTTVRSEKLLPSWNTQAGLSADLAIRAGTLLRVPSDVPGKVIVVAVVCHHSCYQSYATARDEATYASPEPSPGLSAAAPLYAGWALVVRALV